ncbi:MAG: MBL fold metallo-hydrolase [Armatimonadetes bacterium]|nr:MBL fold metallo-hydrolase [Armatimonadota bacterium]MDW8123001.1 MBL fold metallo-hydrolase [Armatimonadota bacterium]
MSTPFTILINGSRLLLVFLMGLAVLVLYWSIGEFRKEALIVFLDVGDGKAIAVRAPSGQTLLVDAGSANYGPGVGAETLALRRILPTLRSLGFHRLSVVLVTHPHQDHYNAVPFLIKEWTPVLFFRPPYTVREPRYLSVLERLQALPTRIIPFFRGQRLWLDSNRGLYADVVFPERKPFFLPREQEVNEASAVLRIVYGKVRVLLTGDAGKKAQGCLLAKGENLRADILDVPHHGSRHNLEDFLRAVQPRVAVISASGRTPNGPPDEKVVAFLKNIGSQVWITGLMGTLVVRTDGERVKLNAEGIAGRKPVDRLDLARSLRSDVSGR